MSDDDAIPAVVDGVTTKLPISEFRKIGGVPFYPVLGTETGVTDTSFPYGDVRRFGAKGDGVTDDSGAIVNAVASANATPGGAVVLLPPAQYLWGSDVESVITNSGVWVVMPGGYPGKQFGATTNRGFGIVLGANQSASIFRFTKDATLRVTNGCGIEVPFIGAARAYTVAGACVNVEYSDNFYHDCSYYAVKGRGLWTQRSVKSRFASVDVYQCGDAGKPAIDVNGIDGSNLTQGSTFHRIAAEVGYGDGANTSTTPYMAVGSLSSQNKFLNLGFESDSADAPSQISYLNVACADNFFGTVHMNRNAGTAPRINVTNSKNQFHLIKSSGIHGGDVMSFVAGQQNVVSNYRIGLADGGGGVGIRFANLTSSSNYNVFGIGSIQGGNGFNIDATSVSTNIGHVTHIQKDSYTIQTAASTTKVWNVVDDVSAAVASAATPVIPDGKDWVSITGTTNITTGITATKWAGRRLVLQFAGILTVTDGSNLKLAGNLTTAAGTTLSLVTDGANWFETGRSIN